MSNHNQHIHQPPLLSRIDGVGQWLAPLGLRTLLAWEFFEAGREKLQGDNWFADIADKFPLPFSLLSPGLNWTLATWFELVASVALLVGLGTRYAAAALWVLTVVAIYAVHWPAEWSSLAELWQGYAITDKGFGNYKLPLIYLVMLLPLILGGGGRLSADHLVAVLRGSFSRSVSGPMAWGLVLLVLGATSMPLLPWAGGVVAVAGAVLLALSRRGFNPIRRFAPEAPIFTS